MTITPGRLFRGEWLTFSAYVAASIYFTFPLLASGRNLGILDWDAILFHHASVIKTVYEYGQLPFWNPWYCGGDVLWQNPQVPLFTPTYLLALAVPLPIAMKLNILLHYIAGFAGMHVLLTRVFKLSFLPGVAFLAAVFTLAGGASLHVAVGHATFLPYFYLPWLLVSLVRAVETGALKFAIAAAGLLALAIYSGGMHMAFMSAVGVTCFALASALCRREWRPLFVLGIVGAFSALFAAPKLVPLARFVTDPRIVDIRYFPPAPDRLTLEMLQHAFIDPFQFRRLKLVGQLYDWHEYGNYIGSSAALLVAASVLWIAAHRPWKRDRWLEASVVLTALVVFGLMLGEAGPYAPYALLRRLPFLAQFRLPSRYTLVFLLFAVATVAAAARTAMPECPVAAGLRRFIALMCIIAACSLGYRNRGHLQTAFSLAPLNASFQLLARPGAPVVDAHTDGFGPDSPMLRAMMANRAVLRCNEPLQLPGAIDPGKPIVFGETEDTRISRVSFAPNRVEFRVVTRDRARVFLNERYVRGWRSSIGPLEIDPQTQLAYVWLPSGMAGSVELRFVPPGLVIGLILFVLAVLGAALTWKKTIEHAKASNSRRAVVPQP